MRRRRVEEPADRLGADGPDGDEKEQRVDQRRQDRRLFEPVGEASRWRHLRKPAAAPGDDEPEHVRHVVTGIGNQRDRSGAESGNRLDDDETEIEQDSDRERLAEGCWRAMRMPVGVRMVVMGVGMGRHWPVLARLCRCAK